MGEKDTADKIKEYLDPKSENFMGSGMTMEQLLLTGDAERIQRSFWRQSREERKRRLDIVMRLSVELHRIRQSSVFSTRMAESAIEDLIEGDLVGLKSLVGIFEMDEVHPGPEKERLQALWAEFSRTVKEAIAGWPPDGPQSQEVH